MTEAQWTAQFEACLSLVTAVAPFRNPASICDTVVPITEALSEWVGGGRRGGDGISAPQLPENISSCFLKLLLLPKFLKYKLLPGSLKYSRKPVDQWVKRRPTDLAVPNSSPARGQIFSTVNGVPLSSAHRPDMTEILLKRT